MNPFARNVAGAIYGTAISKTESDRKTRPEHPLQSWEAVLRRRLEKGDRREEDAALRRLPAIATLIRA
jgi:hypothetical protein